MTPDRLLGRAESAWTTFAIVISPLGPLVTGVLIEEIRTRRDRPVRRARAGVGHMGHAQPVDPRRAEHRRAR